MTERTLRVLLLDDEKSLREPLAEHLRSSYGYAVDTVADGTEALRLIQEAQGRYDVALIDEVLEEGPSGLEVLRHIKSKFPEIEVILFTGWGMQAGIEALEAGAYRYFAKPINIDELALTIRFAAEHRRIRQERKYLEALVKASGGLARTTRQEEQLSLVWDFVREQLDVSAFWIALYDQESDLLSFSLAYEKGEPVLIPPRILGGDPSRWGIGGYLAKTNQEMLFSNREELEQTCRSLGIEPIFEGGPTQSCFFLPFQIVGKTLGALSVQSERRYAFNDIVLDAVRSLGHQFAIALQNSQLFAEVEQKAQEAARQANNLRTLQNVALTINSSLDLREILTRTCQAAVELFKVDHCGLVLFDEQSVRGRVETEYPALGTVGTTIPLRGVSREENLVETRKPLVVNDVAAEESFGLVRDIFLGFGIQSLAIVPVISKGRLLGSFGLDSIHHPRQFTQEEVELCETFATQVAVAIENAGLYQAAREGREYLQGLFQASGAILAPSDPQAVLRSIVDTACQTTGAWRVVVLLVDEGERPRVFASSGFDHQLDAGTSVRENGITHQVLHSGQSRFISDTEAAANEVHPAMLAQGTKAAACLPLPLMGRNIGVLWIQFREKHIFAETERNALQVYANQAAIAYDNAWRLWELEHLHAAAEAMTSAASISEVLQQIVNSAQEVLEADYVLIWSYDQTRGVFISEELAAKNIPDEWLARLRNGEPEIGRTTYRVLEAGYVEVTDLSQADFIGENTRSSLETLRVKSFQGIRLELGGEPLSVLYVDYKALRDFSEEEQRVLKHFADIAALTLKRARLLDQVSRSRRAAQAVARMSALGNLEHTLEVIVEGARDALRCDIATVYVFDESLTRFTFVKGAGYKDLAHIRLPEEIKADSALWKILDLKEDAYHVSEDTLNDDLLKSHFVHAEEVRSTLGIQLRFGERRVGVMFISHRTLHRFSDDEIKDALQFADQAAVAIRNAQLFEGTERARKRAELVARISQKASANLEIIDLLDTLYRELEQVLRTPILPSAALWDSQHQNLRFVESRIYDYKSVVIESERRREGIPLGYGITGWVTLHKEPIYVKADIDNDPRYKRFVTTTKSEISVPILYGQERELIGVLDVESPVENAFDEEDLLLLQTLANQLAVAIRNAQLYGETKKRAEALEGLYEAGKTITSTLALEETLQRISKEALRVVGTSCEQEGCFSHIALREGNNLRFIASNSPEMLYTLHQAIGEIDLHQGTHIGIAGRAVITGQSQNVPDVKNDSDYISPRQDIRSQLSVPLKMGQQVIGVLSIENPRPNAFGEEDVRNVELLAAQAAFAIQNAKRYTETERALAARTALAWTGMVSATWRHAIEKHAITIREQVQLLRQDLGRLPKSDSSATRINMIERLANQILEKPITPPLSVEEGAQAIPLNALIRERTKQLWNQEKYKEVRLQLDLALDESATMRASVEWLRRALDILIDNAVEATAGLPERQLKITTRRLQNKAEISISDNGKGIPTEIQAQLFREPIKKPKGTKGLGMGLLFAQTIIQAYGGDIRCGSSGSAGTTMVVSLPLEV